MINLSAKWLESWTVPPSIHSPVRQVTLFFCFYVAAALGSSLEIQAVRDNEAKNEQRCLHRPWADVTRDLHKSLFICTQTHFPILMVIGGCHSDSVTVNQQLEDDGINLSLRVLLILEATQRWCLFI